MHRLLTLWLQETAWDEEDSADYLDYLADFRADFHDLRHSPEHADCLSPTNYTASQALALELVALGSAGIVWPSVRRRGGTSIGCFRPVLVTKVHKGSIFTFVFPDSHSAPTIHRARADHPTFAVNRSVI